MHMRQHVDDFATSMATNGHVKVFRTTRDESDHEFHRPVADSENIYNWIRRCYLESRGLELTGTVNPVVLENKFRQQSSPWGKIALRYLEKVASSVNSFNKETLASILPDDDMREKLRGIFEARG